MSKDLTPLQAAKCLLDEICFKCESNVCAVKSNGFCRHFKNYKIIETTLKNYEQIKKCHLVAIPRMSNKTSIVDELMYLQEVIRVMTTILHYSYTNRFIVKQAFDEGWINETEYQLMIETFGYFNCTGKEEPK